MQHRQGWRLFWWWRSHRPRGRPRLSREVRGGGFLHSDEPGVKLIDACGNVLAEFKVNDISGYTDDVETTRRQVELARATMLLRMD